MLSWLVGWYGLTGKVVMVSEMAWVNWEYYVVMVSGMVWVN